VLVTYRDGLGYLSQAVTYPSAKRIRDLFEYALYKFTLYLLTYLLNQRRNR